MLIRQSGRGLEQLDARQLCNYVLALLLDGRDEDARWELLRDLESPTAGSPRALEAVEMLKRAREASGGTP